MRSIISFARSSESLISFINHHNQITSIHGFILLEIDLKLPSLVISWFDFGHGERGEQGISLFVFEKISINH